MNIEELQNKLLKYYAQGSREVEIYQALGLQEWSDYLDLFDTIWTPKFRFQVYIQTNPESTLEEAFVKGFNNGWLQGFDSGYNKALKDMIK